MYINKLRNTINKGFIASAGFTLVELLIVIGLLGAIALIVIAAINPIEQANRARDTRFRSDGAQLISAIDRYFAARSEFPWESVGTYTTDDDFGFVSANDEEVGICGADCDTDGVLLTTSELKSEFRNRDFVQNPTATDQIMVGKETGASSSVYACFVPLAKSTREKACADGNVFTVSTADGSRTQVPADDPSCLAASTSWGTAPYLYVCIPE